MDSSKYQNMVIWTKYTPAVELDRSTIIKNLWNIRHHQPQQKHVVFYAKCLLGMDGHRALRLPDRLNIAGKWK